MTGFELLPIGSDRLAPSADLVVAAEQLRAAVLIDGEVTEHRDRVLAFLADHHDAAHRSSASGHLTGSALVVDAAGTRTLLMLHRKLGRWFQPGGHADGDTNLAAVALREASEETGVGGLRVVMPAIDVDVHRVAIPGEVAHLHLDTRFLVLAPPGAREQANDESLDLRWVDRAAVATLAPPVDPSTRRLVARGLEVAAILEV
jgi:8-oxo-dGTP pyrophosphatase MutT (NUDIX family)